MGKELDEKLRDCFDAMTVYKDLTKVSFISAFKLPSFMRDWVLQRFQDADGNIDVSKATDFVSRFIPKKEDWKVIKNRIVVEQEVVKIMAKVSIGIDVKSGEVTFSLPDFDLGNKETTIPNYVWEECKDDLLRAEENWGVIELGYLPAEGKKKDGKIVLRSFKDFCPYEVDLDEYKLCRKGFSTNEWIDILLGAIDYNAEGYENSLQKITMLTRLLPFVEKRLNIIELAPKGTGKSYLFGQISRFGWLSSGGIMSRAKMFWDMQKKKEGLVFGHDYVALDEIQTITFKDVDEMRGILKGYMENNGQYTVGDHKGAADSGIILLGNISTNYQNEYQNMFTELPEVFHESALIDRFHGFIKGWDLPRMNNDLKVCGWALNSEYFSSIMHMLRDDPVYRAVVDEMIICPEQADTRDTEAVKRIATAYLKLLFPQVESPEDILPKDFWNYCLRPAMDMRGIIKIQLGILDDEYKGKAVPTLTVCGL